MVLSFADGPNQTWLGLTPTVFDHSLAIAEQSTGPLDLTDTDRQSDRVITSHTITRKGLVMPYPR